MSYPALSRADARTYLNAVKLGASPEQPLVRVVNEGEELDWESIADDLVARLSKLATGDAVKKRSDSRGAEFEIAAAPIIHQLLPMHEALADPDFWTWLGVIKGPTLVSWRYQEDPDPKNFGIGSPGENLLFRIWLRAEVALVPTASEPYELVGVGDIDFWRSHIFRQSYADARSFARALVEFQFPKEGGRKPRLSITEIRDLAKHLKRARTNLLFEIMDAERAKGFIESEWARLASPA
jgi:hypothetical protein